ncbi:MAG: hypothetical protein ACXIU8_09475, partial [Alkalilacustris sp.]
MAPISRKLSALHIPPATERVRAEQASGVRAIMAGCWIMVPVVLGAAFVAGQSLLALGAAALVVAALGTLGTRLRPDLARLAVSQALVGMAILLTTALAGHPWQLDSHMLFFAVLATFVLLIDPKVFLLGAATIAVHHLALGIFAPVLVYPSTNLLENLQRTVFHAVILLIETVALFFTVARRRQSDAQVADAADAERARAAREVEEQEAGLARQQTVVEALKTGLSGLARGDLTTRISTSLPEEYEPIRRDFNKLGAGFEGLITEIQSSATAVQETAAQLAQGSGEMSHRAETQAATLEESAAALDEMTASVK